MVFKRRDRRSLWRTVREFVWPRGGWRRAFHYVRHRLHRLPDAPHRIARGVFAGVMVSFSPFFGLHFLLAALIALIIRGNVVAALLATFVGNPLTFVGIATLSLETGRLVLGRMGEDGALNHRSLGGKFVDAWGDLKGNFLSMFTGSGAEWDKLHVFFHDIFFPYMIGGLIVGPIAGLVFYYLSLPIITAYQHRRKGRIKEKLMALKKNTAGKAEAGEKRD